MFYNYSNTEASILWDYSVVDIYIYGCTNLDYSGKNIWDFTRIALYIIYSTSWFDHYGSSICIFYADFIVIPSAAALEIITISTYFPNLFSYLLTLSNNFYLSSSLIPPWINPYVISFSSLGWSGVYILHLYAECLFSY